LTVKLWRRKIIVRFFCQKESVYAQGLRCDFKVNGTLIFSWLIKKGYVMPAEAIKEIAVPATEVIREVVTGLSFWQQVLATLIGVIVGFGFSIFLIRVQQWLQKKTLKKNLHKEIKYNSDYLKDLKQNISETMKNINAGLAITYVPFNLNLYSRTFLGAYFNNGYLFDVLGAQEIKDLSQTLLVLTEPTQKYIETLLSTWRSDPSSVDAKDTLLKLLVTIEDVVDKAISLNEMLKEKL